MENLTLWEFIMEYQEWMLLGTACLTFLVAGLTWLANMRKTENTDKLLGSAKDELKTEHKSLSTEHKSLSTEHKSLSTEHKSLSEKLNSVVATTSYLRDEARDTKIRRENATNHELNAIKIQEQLAGYSEFVEHLKAENKELKVKIAKLENEKQPRKSSQFDLLRPKQQDEDMDLEP